MEYICVWTGTDKYNWNIQLENALSLVEIWRKIDHKSRFTNSVKKETRTFLIRFSKL
jgi:hypothetical protein